tara:strand:+ start:1789 stop:2055 length:267 start_codon:yes stop_codon:yes gene_type:complete
MASDMCDQCETHLDAVGKEVVITCEECASVEWLQSRSDEDALNSELQHYDKLVQKLGEDHPDVQHLAGFLGLLSAILFIYIATNGLVA